jgi:hypothetical protein
METVVVTHRARGICRGGCRDVPAVRFSQPAGGSGSSGGGVGHRPDLQDVGVHISEARLGPRAAAGARAGKVIAIAAPLGGLFLLFAIMEE